MNTNLIQYFERTAEQYPQKAAVVDRDGSLSFRDLQSLAHNLALSLRTQTASINAPIAIYLPKSNQAVAAILGVLYSGNIYAPLDVKNPLARTDAILKNLKPACILTDTAGIAQLQKIPLEVPILNIGEMGTEKIHEEIVSYQKCIDTDPAYILHTSGSTGMPKGVAISHRSIMDYIHWAIDTFNISHREHIGNQAPLVFDNSTLDIYLMVFTGATLNLIPESLFMYPARLLEYLKAQKINFVFWVPSVLVNVANLRILDTIKVSSLRKILFAGEVMPAKQLNYWIGNFDKDVLFANLYGPTEITVDCTYHIITSLYKDDEVIPIGKACRNSDILILNEKDQICEIGEKGELCVRGSSLALGYWNNLEKTREVFVQNPLNTAFPERIYRTGDIVYLNESNEIMFVGRKDNQIKHLGYRIELGEIEHGITSSFEGLTPCVFYDNQNKKIVLVYESRREIPPGEFRKRLMRVLSKYMLPSEYIRIDKMPLTGSGKTNRSLLKRNYLENIPFNQETEFVSK